MLSRMPKAFVEDVTESSDKDNKMSNVSIDVVTIDSILLEHTAIMRYMDGLRAAVAE
jgi:hypothetical protein